MISVIEIGKIEMVEELHCSLKYHSLSIIDNLTVDAKNCFECINEKL